MDEQVSLWISSGRKHFESGDFKEAENYFIRALHFEPYYADLWNMLGVIYMEQERLSEAETAFQKSLAINPAYTEAALNLSVTLNESGKYNEAREVYSQAIAHSYPEQEETGQNIDPFAKRKISAMHGKLGDVYFELRYYEQSIREYRHALELNKDFFDLRTKLGHALRDHGRKEEALTEYKQVKHDKPNYLPARLALGVCLFSLGRNTEARAEWQQCVSMAPTDRRAAAYLRMLNRQKASQKAKT